MTPIFLCKFKLVLLFMGFGRNLFWLGHEFTAVPPKKQLEKSKTFESEVVCNCTVIWKEFQTFQNTDFFFCFLRGNRKMTKTTLLFIYSVLQNLGKHTMLLSQACNMFSEQFLLAIKLTKSFSVDVRIFSDLKSCK